MTGATLPVMRQPGHKPGQKGGQDMQYWRIDYYRTRNWIDTKYIKDEFAQGAIKKARVKNIVDVEEISEEEYKAGLARRKAAAQAKKARRAEFE